MKPILQLLKKNFKIKGLAHTTGGGLRDNVLHILPENYSAAIEKGTWDVLAVFPFLQQRGIVAEDEMYRVFNMGIGTAIVTSRDHASHIIDKLEAAGETAYIIGEVV